MCLPDRLQEVPETFHDLLRCLLEQAVSAAGEFVQRRPFAERCGEISCIVDRRDGIVGTVEDHHWFGHRIEFPEHVLGDAIGEIGRAHV